MANYKIILADDHALIREGLKKILEGKADYKVIGEARDGLELLALLKKLTPDLIILDISMPNLRGLEAICEIKTVHPTVKILVLTVHKEQEYLFRAISSGANGYLLKEDANGELFSAIEAIRREEIYLSSIFSKELPEDWVQKLRWNQPILTEDPLTTRERQILKLIAEGKSCKEIGDLLFISRRTVEHHRANIMEKLNLRKVADLVKYALKRGYLYFQGGFFPSR